MNAATEIRAVGPAPLAGGSAGVQRRRRLSSARQFRLVRTALLAVVLVMVIAGVLVAAWSPSAAADNARPDVATQVVVVDEGDSLWDIVEDRSYDRDLRDVIEEVRALNGMSTGVVHPGQSLEVPAR